MVKKIKKVQKEGKNPKSTNYHFTINNKKPILPVQTILLTDLVFLIYFNSFHLENLTSGYAFIGELTLNNYFATVPLFLEKNAIPYPHSPMGAPMLTTVFQFKHRITKYINSR